ncbi:MAG: preprotein translocase subunit SecE [Lentisphaeria bacterium]
MKNPIKAIQKLYFETASEMKKCSWPNRAELGESTVLIISFLIIMSVYIAAADKILETIVRLITGSL